MKAKPDVQVAPVAPTENPKARYVTVQWKKAIKQKDMREMYKKMGLYVPTDGMNKRFKALGCRRCCHVQYLNLRLYDLLNFFHVTFYESIVPFAMILAPFIYFMYQETDYSLPAGYESLGADFNFEDYDDEGNYIGTGTDPLLASADAAADSSAAAVPDASSR